MTRSLSVGWCRRYGVGSSVTVLYQGIGDTRCIRTSVTVWFGGTWTAGLAVADVADSGSGPWVFDKDLPGGVGDNDRVVDGDET